MKKSCFPFLLLFITSQIYAQRTPTLGSTIPFDADQTTMTRSAKLDDTHFIVVYKGIANGLGGLTAVGSDIFAIVGEVDASTKTISWGTRVAIETDDQSRPFVIGISSTQAVVGYEYAPGDDEGRARVLTISGTTISSVGTASKFSAGDFVWASGTHLGSGKIAIAYDDLESTNQGTVVIGDISGTDITFGSPVNFTTSSGVNTPDINTISATRFVVAYEEDGIANDPGKVVIGDVSGTGIIYGTAATFHSNGSANAARETSVAVLNSTTLVIAFANEGSANEGSAIVGTISGSNITFDGAIVEFDNAFTIRDIDIEPIVNDEFIIVYNGNTSTDPGKIIVGERSGNAINFGTAVEYLSKKGDDNRVVVLDNDTFVSAFIDDENTPTDQGEAVVGTLPSLAPTSATIAATVFLEGAYNGTSLNTTLNSSIPMAQPYSGSGFNNHSGTESASAPAGAVDWVLVELREAASAATALASTKVGSAAGFLMNDGSIKATDGTSNLSISLSGNSSSDFFVVIYHRNHLPIMSAVTQSASGTITIDFTSASAMAYQGASAVSALSGGKFGMIAGDADGDGDVDGIDLTTWRGQNGGTFGYNTTNGDFNLDGEINAVDRNDYQQKNASKTSQVPTT